MLAKPKICEYCPALTVGQGFVPPEGDPAALVRICGEAPGEDERDDGRPFVGRSGQVLRRQMGVARVPSEWCKECKDLPWGVRSQCRPCAGVGRRYQETVYIYNLTSCRPPGNAFNLIPAEAIPYCMGQYVAPAPAGSVTYLVGARALVQHFPELATVKGMGSIERWHGSVLPLGEGWAMPVLHPAGVMRGWTQLPLIGFDLAGGLGLVGRRPADGPPFPLPVLTDELPNGHHLTLDIETGEDEEITLIGATGDGVKVWQGWGNQARKLQPAVDAAEIVFAHNAKFDVTRLESVGLRFRRERVIDTMNAAAIYQSSIVRKAAGLDDVAALVLPGEQTYWKALYGSRWSPAETELTRRIWSRIWPGLGGEVSWFHGYNALDVVMTHRIGTRLRMTLS